MAKQYKFWIDVQDLLAMIKLCLQRLQLFAENQAASDKATDAQCLIEQVADNDAEIVQLLTALERTWPPGAQLEDVLQLARSPKRVYLVENQKVVTQVYATKLRSEVEEALGHMVRKLQDYQARFQSKTLRLCFSSQQELFSIFAKIFGQELLAFPPFRKVVCCCEVADPQRGVGGVDDVPGDGGDRAAGVAAALLLPPEDGAVLPGQGALRPEQAGVPAAQGGVREQPAAHLAPDQVQPRRRLLRREERARRRRQHPARPRRQARQRRRRQGADRPLHLPQAQEPQLL